MPKYLVEMIVSYPLVLEGKTMEEVLDLAENLSWDDWPDDEAEILEYAARMVDEEEKATDHAPAKPAIKSSGKFTVINGGQ